MPENYDNDMHNALCIGILKRGDLTFTLNKI